MLHFEDQRSSSQSFSEPTLLDSHHVKSLCPWLYIIPPTTQLGLCYSSRITEKRTETQRGEEICSRWKSKILIQVIWLLSSVAPCLLASLVMAIILKNESTPFTFTTPYSLRIPCPTPTTWDSRAGLSMLNSWWVLRWYSTDQCDEETPASKGVNLPLKSHWPKFINTLCALSHFLANLP